jgi:raffinose/stachyose/melibiose transport system substrate-binding protein
MCSNKVSRREFLKIGVLTGTGAVLAARVPQVAAAPAAAQATEASEHTLVALPAAEEVTTINSYDWFMLDCEKGGLAMNAKFEEQHPNIKINRIKVPPGPAEWLPLISSALASDDPPDMTYSGGRGFMTAWARDGQFIDLTDEIKGWGYPFVSGLVDQMTYRGVTYAAPFNIQFKFMTYRKDVYEQAGAQIPTTWTEYLSSGKELMKQKITPCAFGALGADVWASLNWGALFNQKLMGKKTVITDMEVDLGKWDNPGYEKALELLVYLNDEKYFGVNPLSRPHQVAQAKVNAGEAASIYSGSWDIGPMLDPSQTPEGFIDKCLFEPQIWHDPEWPGEKFAVQGGTIGFSVPTRAKHPQEGLLLLKWYESPEGQQIFHDYSRYIMANTEVKAAFDYPQLVDLVEKFKKCDGMFDFVDQSGDPTVWQVYGKSIEGVLNKEITPKEGMAQVIAAADKARPK